MRLFLGVEAPASPAYAQVTRFLRERHAAFRPVPPGSWHATLRFIGEADPEAVARAVAPALRDAHAVPVVIHGIGAFPDPARARIVWARVTAGGLADLAARLRAATPVRNDAEATREFQGHVTLGRSEAPMDVSRSVADLAGTQFGEAWFQHVTLFASEATPNGHRYTPLRRFPLVHIDPDDRGLPRWQRHFPWRGEALAPPPAPARPTRKA